ncbi:hypothetical protein CLD22_08610 [Rubrivivax gelatinosus]|nr:hypothetical protein [Rubrivivax gelatinosus]
MRAALLRLHRWVGLVLAGFLLLAGLTGSLLAWNDELETALNPDLFVAAPAGSGPALDPLLLRERVQAAFPQALVLRAPLQIEAGSTLVFRLYARPGGAGAAPLADDQVFVNPWTGRIQGQRRWGDIGQGRKNLMPFVLRLHDSLAITGIGNYLMGLVALLWTLDCFAGAWLTLPARAGSAGPAAWLARWWPAWCLRWRGGAHKLNFDLHRAGGLWPWPMLFVLAWSSVAFNLREVYEPVMRTLFVHQLEPAPPPGGAPLLQPPVGWQQAREAGRARLQQASGTRGFALLGEYMLIYDPRRGEYGYYARTTLDVSERWGLTRVGVDARSGETTGLWLPTGGAAGDSLRTWLTTLHMAAVGGWPMRVFVSLTGLAVAVLAVTGVLIWLRKRRAVARRAALQPACARPAP